MLKMTSQILIDANVFIYAEGRDHAAREPARQILKLIAQNDVFFTDAEVLQELLHRYTLTGTWERMAVFFGGLLRLLAGRVEPMTADDVQIAASLVTSTSRLSARDLIHLAIMRRTGSTRIVTADRAFDNFDGIERLDPMQVEEWAPRVTGN